MDSLKTINYYLKNRFHIDSKLLTNIPKHKMEFDIRISYKASKKTLGNYVTLDYNHRKAILEIIEDIIEYKHDVSRKRPLNFLMIANPGTGKSHFVKSLVSCEKLKMICQEVTFNMTNIRNIDDFVHPLGSVRNIKVNDRLPVLFLDEIDGREDNYSMVLPLLYDGELLLNGRLIELGKTVIILASSDKELNKKVNTIKKLGDFLSRINGGRINIPDLDELKLIKDSKVDKLCIALSLIEKRYNKVVKSVRWNILWFISNTCFKFGVRSIAYLIDALPKIDQKNKNILTDSNYFNFLDDKDSLQNSWLNNHIDPDQIDDTIELWRKVKDNKSIVNFL